MEEEEEHPKEEAKPKKPTRIEKLFSVCEIRPFLFIAGYGALSEKKFRELGVTHAVDATNLPKPLRIPNTEYFDVKGDDSELFEIKKYFQKCSDFIKSAKDGGGKTIVYCAAGVSRSACLCMIYLMMHEGLTLEESYVDVARVRPLIAPNIGFWRQMIDFEKSQNNGKSTVELLKGMSRPVPSVYLYKSKITGS